MKASVILLAGSLWSLDLCFITFSFAVTPSFWFAWLCGVLPGRLTGSRNWPLLIKTAIVEIGMASK